MIKCLLPWKELGSRFFFNIPGESFGAERATIFELNVGKVSAAARILFTTPYRLASSPWL